MGTKREKKYNKKVKKMLVALGITTLISTFAIAGVLLFFADVQTDVNVSNLLNINDIPAENLLITNTINGFPNETHVRTYYLNATQDLTVYFIVDSDDNITTNVKYMGNPVTELGLTANTNTTITIEYYIPINTTSGTYPSSVKFNPTP